MVARRIFLSRLAPSGHGPRDLRGPQGTHRHPRPALKKTRCGTCGRAHCGGHDRKTRRVRWRQCGAVKRERLELLADNPLYTKRFAYFVGRCCRASPIRDVARELALDWHTFKELDKQHMRAQLARAGTPASR